MVLLGLATTASAQGRLARRVMDAPSFTIHPQGALPIFAGESVGVVVGWRPVTDAARYRVTLTDASGRAIDYDLHGLRWEHKGLVAGSYSVVVTALDRMDQLGTPSDPLPINVIEVRAIPPGAKAPAPPTRGAYAVGARFSVAGMHCEFGDAPIDDLIVGPENEASLPMAGLARLRCAGMPGYLEKQVVIAPVRIAARAARVSRGQTTVVTLTIGSVAELGKELEVKAIGDLSTGAATRTDFGLEVPVTVAAKARRGALSVQSAGLELGRVELELVDGPPPPTPVVVEPVRPDLVAFDLGGQVGALSFPDGGRAPTLGSPTNNSDVLTGGALVGLRVGYFPISRLGLEGEVSFVRAGYTDETADVAKLLLARGQLAVRVLEGGALGLRAFLGTGVVSTLEARGTSGKATESELHAGAAFTVETSPNLWLRFQVADVVMTARDNGYAHAVEFQLGVVTRVGRRDAW